MVQESRNCQNLAKGHIFVKIVTTKILNYVRHVQIIAKDSAKYLVHPVMNVEGMIWVKAMSAWAVTPNNKNSAGCGVSPACPFS